MNWIGILLLLAVMPGIALGQFDYAAPYTFSTLAFFPYDSIESVAVDNLGGTIYMSDANFNYFDLTENIYEYGGPENDGGSFQA